MSTENFATLPHRVARDAHIEPFHIAIPQHEIDRLHLLLDNCPVADANWEISQEDGRFGVTRDWLTKAVKDWRHNYNWRQWEAQFNSYPQYMIDVKDDDGKAYSIRFNALFSTNPKALPIIFLHGWPGSAVEFLPMLELIKQQYQTADSLPYHIIVPDLIGFGFSSRPPIDKDYGYDDNARILVKMMHSLGFTAENGGYMTQGGDLGGTVAPKMAVLDPENCRLAHVNVLAMPPPEGADVEEDIRSGKYTPEEAEALRNGMAFFARGAAYAAIQGTRPATCGLAIGSSPVALFAWIGEKFIEWSDPESRPSLEHILTNVSYYWFTKCYPTSVWIYRLMVAEGSNIRSGWVGIQRPLGYSWFKSDAFNPPKQWRDRIGIAKWFRYHERGGHFAALEQPNLLWEDVVDMIADFDLQPRN
ncbi:Alpha/Beta hydrolase protein [Ilyonectria robusta]|uniref:Alpha/Beta hydrolase protein n=1 Tax=Ilyonectria robusta TaxID=1079257 RepID=UPI001E8D070B|nr:Alpha/Beta hydrolase protein [Ilyonectria robusta]KAH8734206.1 Alpha/Beta hydrolase protein [Ilyonectria robusta]